MDTKKIVDFIMTTPKNVNWNVLSTMLDEGEWIRLKQYVEATSWNMNRKVLESFFGESQSNIAVVGTAIVGQSVVS